MLAYEAGGKQNPRTHSAKQVHGLAKTSKPCSFQWTSSFCSLSSVCTSLLRTHYPNSYPCPSSVLKYKRRNEGPSRILNLIAFSILFVPSLVGAIGLAVRGASRKGKGLCEEFISKHPENCTEAAVAITLAWVSVVIGAPYTSLASYVVDLTVH